MGPRTPAISLSSRSRWSAATAPGLVVLSSSKTSWTGRPLMPPALFACSTASSAPHRMYWPDSAPSPVIETIWPILTGVPFGCAAVGRAPAATAVIPASRPASLCTDPFMCPSDDGMERRRAHVPAARTSRHYSDSPALLQPAPATCLTAVQQPTARHLGAADRANVSGMTGVPYRDTFWNVPVPVEVLLYAGALVAIALFARGLWQRIRLWRGGGPEPRFDRVGERLWLVATEALGQARTLSQAYPGVMHAIMVWGFLALLTGTVLATIDWDITLPLFGMKLLQGPFYLFYEAVLDLFGLFFVIGLGMAVYRRFVVRPHRLDAAARFARALALLLAINVSGFLVEACRLAATRPPWAPWSPVGWAIGQGLQSAGHGPGALRAPLPTL